VHGALRQLRHPQHKCRNCNSKNNQQRGTQGYLTGLP
jgi:hypothetical protein